MSVIFRVEDVNGGGMYNGYNRPLIPHVVGMDDYERRPFETPVFTRDWRDDPAFIPGTHYFGFADLRQLSQWIANEEWLDLLIGAGFIINIYRIEYAHYRKSQCFFTKSAATLVSTLGLHTIRREVIDEQETDVDVPFDC